MMKFQNLSSIWIFQNVLSNDAITWNVINFIESYRRMFYKTKLSKSSPYLHSLFYAALVTPNSLCVQI